MIGWSVGSLKSNHLIIDIFSLNKSIAGYGYNTIAGSCDACISPQFSLGGTGKVQCQNCVLTTNSNGCDAASGSINSWYVLLIAFTIITN